VVDGDDRFAAGKSSRLHPLHANQQGTDEAGASGYRKSVDGFERDARLFQRTIDDIVQHAEVCPRSQLRYDAAVKFVNVLGEDDVAEQIVVAAQHGSRRFVAGSFNRKQER
jgi:hypothetical protein